MDERRTGVPSCIRVWKGQSLVYQQATKAAKELGVDYIHTRIFSVYGPGDHPWSLIETCIRTFLANGNMEMGPCTQQWNFLYVQEAAQILVKLLLGKFLQACIMWQEKIQDR